MSKTYTFDDDPHLMALTLGKSIGLVGVFLALALFFEFARIGLAAGRATGARDPLGRILIFGLCAYVLLDSLETNILLSFGRIADRFASVTAYRLLLDADADCGHAGLHPPHEHR